MQLISISSHFNRMTVLFNLCIYQLNCSLYGEVGFVTEFVFWSELCIVSSSCSADESA